MADTNLLPAPNGYQQSRQPLYGTLLTVPLLPGDNSSINHCEDDNQQQHWPMPPPSSIDGEDDNESLGGVTASTINPVGDDRMRRRLKYFFMTPCEKYQAKGRLPLKLLLQLLKVLLVTMQLYVFGMESSGHVYFLKTAQTAFKHLFLESWDPSWETPPYPPSHGPYAVYTYDSFYSAINFALAGYNGTASDSVGSFAPPAAANESQTEPPSLCLMHYANLTVDAANFRYVSTRCFEMLPLPDGNETWRYDTRRLLEEEGYNLNFDIVLTAQLQFYILFDNRAHTGQVQMSLIADPIERRCSVEEQFGQIEKAVSYTILDVSVILVCLLSFVSCVRSLYKGNRMRLVRPLVVSLVVLNLLN
uniref:PKD_channel domain-containing protein n=1 Tax=Macrostomum lignano TaxID=282301 RepID=A0A1I8GV96_9PLAT